MENQSELQTRTQANQFAVSEFGSLKRANLNGNFPFLIRFFRAYGGINCDAEFKMDFDTEDDQANAKKFRDYAAQCRRLARSASETDRATLMEIAEAWMVCAEQAERNARRDRKN